jgi:hypothetical protein
MKRAKVSPPPAPIKFSHGSTPSTSLNPSLLNPSDAPQITAHPLYQGLANLSLLPLPLHTLHLAVAPQVSDSIHALFSLSTVHLAPSQTGPLHQGVEKSVPWLDLHCGRAIESGAQPSGDRRVSPSDAHTSSTAQGLFLWFRFQVPRLSAFKCRA